MLTFYFEFLHSQEKAYRKEENANRNLNQEKKNEEEKSEITKNIRVQHFIKDSTSNCLKIYFFLFLWSCGHFSQPERKDAVYIFFSILHGVEKFRTSFFFKVITRNVLLWLLFQLAR